MGYFKDKIAVVTGAASGIGEALARELAKQQAIVYLLDVAYEKAQQVAEEIIQQGGKATAHSLDVRDFEAFSKCIDEIQQQHQGIDFFFNNAGIGYAGEIKDKSLDDWNRIIDINLRGVVHGIRCVYPHMVEKRSGQIINTASMAGLVPAPTMTSYCTTKFAVVGLSLSLRGEAKQYGVKINALCPGVIDTPIVKHTTYQGMTFEDAKQEWDRLPKMEVNRFARKVLKCVRRNQAIIILPFPARIVWHLYRWFPFIANMFHYVMMKKLQKIKR